MFYSAAAEVDGALGRCSTADRKYVFTTEDTEDTEEKKRNNKKLKNSQNSESFVVVQT